MERMNDLKDLLKHEIQDLYSVEEQIIEALPAMIDKASNTKLKNALTEHLRITEEHKNRLDKIQKSMHEKQEEKKGFLSGLFGGNKQSCKGMEGIIEEGNKMMNEEMEPRVLDAVIIACAQKVEHYEICGYGTARTYSRELGMEKVTKLLEQTLKEEYEADDLLTKLAVTGLNQKAESSTEKENVRPESSASTSRNKSESSRVKSGPELQPATHTRGSAPSSRSNAGNKGGHPKSSESTRSTSSGRGTASSKRTTSNTRSSRSESKSTGRGSKGGRGR